VKLTILLFASLRERAGREALEVAGLPEPLDVAGLKRELERRHPELGSLASARGVLGTRYVADATGLEDGAELALLPPVSGGAPDADEALERGLFELSAEPLDPQACQLRVEHPSCGACVVFTGLTRQSSRGRRVLRLEYEAFEAMAGPEMGRIFERCRAEHGGADPERRLRMLVQHRVGTVEVGQPSVVIAVAAPHRESAFLACRFLIDELKRSLPVWKKEHYADGSAWVGERS
jgi:molybdopterin synthase catalytic subunit/molybdopterin converting factor small subunit